jgi:hypothetical protein
MDDAAIVKDPDGVAWLEAELFADIYRDHELPLAQYFGLSHKTSG